MAATEAAARKFAEESQRRADTATRRLAMLEAAVDAEIPAVVEVELLDATEAFRRLADLTAASRGGRR